MYLFENVANDFEVLFGSVVNQLKYEDHGDTRLKLSGRLFVDVVKIEESFGRLLDVELDLLVDALNGDLTKDDCYELGVKIDTYWKTLQFELSPVIDAVLAEAGFVRKSYDYEIEASWYGTGDVRVLELKPRYFEWA